MLLDVSQAGSLRHGISQLLLKRAASTARFGLFQECFQFGRDLRLLKVKVRRFTGIG